MLYYEMKQIAQPLMFHTARGVRVAVREAIPADIPLLAELLGRLSRRTLEFRYMSSRPFSAQVIWQEATRIAQGHTDNHLTLVATTQRQGSEEAIAVGELVCDQQTPVGAEIGLVVRDDEQRQGIGSVLFWQLLRAAQRRGIRRLHANLLAENRGVRRLLQRLGLPYTATMSRGEIEAIISVPAQFEQHILARYSNKLAA